MIFDRPTINIRVLTLRDLRESRVFRRCLRKARPPARQGEAVSHLRTGTIPNETGPAGSVLCNGSIDSELAPSVKAQFSPRDDDPRKRTTTMTDIVDWQGLSGTKYRYWVLENPRNPDSVQAAGGNYAFVKKLPNGNYVPIYFGIADNLKDRIPTHERFEDAIRAGATHVMAHTTPAGAAARIAEERDLIQQWNPSLNVHHRTTG
jgi:hypothetical protein